METGWTGVSFLSLALISSNWLQHLQMFYDALLKSSIISCVLDWGNVIKMYLCVVLQMCVRRQVFLMEKIWSPTLLLLMTIFGKVYNFPKVRTKWVNNLRPKTLGMRPKKVQYLQLEVIHLSLTSGSTVVFFPLSYGLLWCERSPGKWWWTAVWGSLWLTISCIFSSKCWTF